MDEVAYRTYHDNREKAQELYNTIDELYGEKFSDKLAMCLKAKMNGIITDTEYELLRNYGPTSVSRR